MIGKEKKVEEWKDVLGYEGFYQVSNKGNVRSVDRYCPGSHAGCYIRRKGQKMKQQKNAYGYCVITLRKPGEKKTFFIHRLVAQAFLPNPQNLPEINHKDEMKDNNFVENLEWCDRLYNLNYGTFIERRVANTDYNKIWKKRYDHFGKSGGNKSRGIGVEERRSI